MSADRVKPLFLIKPGSMSRPDIRRAERLSGICIIECKEPESARFLDPPVPMDIDAQARAALSLTRSIINMGEPSVATFRKADLMKWFLDALIKEPPPQAIAKVKR